MRYLTILLISFASFLVFTPTASAGTGEIRYTYRVSTPILKTLANGQTRIGMDNAGVISTPGQPSLPTKNIRLALPPEADLSKLDVHIRAIGEKHISGRHLVVPAPPRHLLNGSATAYFGKNHRQIVDGYDTSIYNEEAIFPAQWGTIRDGIGELRRYRIQTIALNPVRYSPSDKGLKYASEMEILIRFKTSNTQSPRVSTDCGSDLLAQKIIDNYDVARLWYPPQCHPLTDPLKGVAVITTEDLEAQSHMLEDYLAMRRSRGFDINVYTESDWNSPTGKTMDSRADRIRAWLKANYEQMGLGYVFLIGNPDPSDGIENGIPMKLCGTLDDPSISAQQAPTDFYYADLSGTWDANGNGLTCEYGENGVISDQVDFLPELYVGRLPVYSDGGKAIDEILSRIIEYEAASESGDISWRRRMMLPNSIYFYEYQEGSNGMRWDGASTGEWFIRDEFIPRGLDWTTLYEDEGVAPSIFNSHMPINTFNVLDQWTRGYGLVFWTGHGSSTGVYRTIWTEDTNEDEIANYGEISSPEFMHTDLLHYLTEAPPPFVIHGSCSNGTPETPSNLGYSVLRRGAISTLSATRVAAAWHIPDYETENWEKLDEWDGCVIDIVTEYAVRLLDGFEAGRAHGTAIALTTDGAGSNSWYQKSIQNLYGDPLSRLVVCREDSDCNNWVLCDGEEICDDGSCVPGLPKDCDPVGGCETECHETEGCIAVEGCTPEPEPETQTNDGGSEIDTDAGSDTDNSVGGEMDSGVDEVFHGKAGDGSNCRTSPARSRQSLFFVLLEKLF
jgi:Peptidase family C25/Propeptide_C25